MRVNEARATANGVDFPLLAELTESAGQLFNHAVLPGADFVEVELGFAERDAEMRRFAGIGHDFGNVQKRLRGYAAAVQADTPGIDLLVDKRHIHA